MAEAPDHEPHVADAPSAGDAVTRAVDAALANAALEGIHIPADERALIEAHQRGELSDRDFLALARDIAQRKAGGPDD
jgi:hypothetical protein